MKTKLLIAFLFSSLFLFGQKIDIPVQYEKAYKQNKKEQKKLEKKFDFVLSPIEVTPMVPQSYEAGTAYNWGNRNLGVTDRMDDILKRSKRKVAVFIFDTGGDWDHSYLQGFKADGKSFTGEPVPIDGNGHSTHVAGIIGATNGGQELGVARGLVQRGLIKAYPYKVLSNEGGGLYSWMTSAVTDANEEAKKLISGGWFVIYNFSLGGGNSYDPFDKVLTEAVKMGVLVFSASGNSGKKGVIYPANTDNCIAIAATDSQNKKASFSTFGEQVEFGAPGVGIASTYLGGTIQSLSGTSMGTPAMSGVAAITASVYPTASSTEILAHLRKYAVDIPPSGKDDDTGHGLTLIDNILDNPIGNIDEPDDDEPDEEKPTREKRKITVSFPSSFSIMWKAYSEGEFKETKLSIEVELETNKFSLDAIEGIQQETEKHFSRRYYIIPKDDFLDAAYWAGYFYELLVGRGKDFKVKILENKATYQGMTAQPPSKGAISRMLQKRKIQTLTY